MKPTYEVINHDGTVECTVDQKTAWNLERDGCFQKPMYPKPHILWRALWTIQRVLKGKRP